MRLLIVAPLQERIIRLRSRCKGEECQDKKCCETLQTNTE